MKKIVGMTVVILFLWGSTKEDRSARAAGKGNDAPRRKHKLKGSGNVDGPFMEKIQSLLKIVVPTWTSKESKYIVILTLLLVLRT